MKELSKLDLLRIKCLTFSNFLIQKFGNSEALQKLNGEIEKLYKEGYNVPQNLDRQDN